MAVEAGADEIDIVLALNSFMAGDDDAARAEIRTIGGHRRDRLKAGRTVTLKVILETGLLVTPENIAKASLLAMEEGADFIKTSTGKVSVNATPMASYIMCECIKAFYDKTGTEGRLQGRRRNLHIERCGMLSFDREIHPWKRVAEQGLFRFGVSRLANSLMSSIEQKTVAYF